MLIELTMYIALLGIFVGFVVPTVFDMQKQGMLDIDNVIYEYKK